MRFISGYKYTQLGLYVEALGVWEGWDAVTPLDDYILFYRSRSYLGLGRCGEAKGGFRELLRRFPESRWAPYAHFQVETEVPCPPLIVRSESVIDCDGEPGLDQRADCHFMTRDYGKARDLYRDLVEVSSEKKEGHLIRLSQAAARSGDFETASRANERLVAEFSQRPAGREARIKLALLEEDAGRWREASERWQKLWEDPSYRQERSWIGEKLGWRHFRLREFRRAVEVFEEVPESPFSLYWLARALEKLGRKEEARERFHRLLERYPGDYYSLRAIPRLSGSKEQVREWWPERRPIRWATEQRFLPQDAQLEKILALRKAGLSGEALIEVRRFRIGQGVLPPNDLDQWKQGEEGVSFPVRFPKNSSEDYPLPHAGFLFPAVKTKGGRVSPWLVYAMMRQESGFRPKEVSRSGARGLLQIMPETGRRLAAEGGWADFHPDWLFDPLSNIELSVRYLKKLSRLYGGRWHLMAAAYSAGERKVAEWLKARGHLNEEEFIEEIPYEETRNYVKKVYANWQAYRWIYR